MQRLIFTLLLLAAGLVLSAQNQHYVAFCATEDGSFGHAFVSIGYEDPERAMTVFDGSWGKHPAVSVGLKDIFTYVGGDIVNDAMEAVDHIYVVKATPSEYRRVKALIKKQRAYPDEYNLLAANCVNFIMSVAEIFEKRIDTPTRLYSLSPSKYINRLIDLNE